MNLSDNNLSRLTVGIDATNLRSGGGVTHLVELISAANPEQYGIARVIVWGGSSTLVKLPNKPWLIKNNPVALNKGFFFRTFWQWFHLSNAVTWSDCDVLFVPGGSYAGHFKPIVTMSQNLLPFEWQELRRFGLSLPMFKLLFLRYTQSRSICSADGVIFLTLHAFNIVKAVTGKINGRVKCINHGVSQRIACPPRKQRSINDYTFSNPYIVQYVSIINFYKHQWNVIEAVYALRAEGFPVALELIGPAHSEALQYMNKVKAKLDPDNYWAHYRGEIPYNDLAKFYSRADLGVFASSCENMPNILLEMMGAGLPIACSNRGPMPEVLGDTGLYFDPENPADIAKTVKTLMLSECLREDMARASFIRSQEFSWKKCADQTFSFLADIATGS